MPIRHRLAMPIGIADGEHNVADFQLVAVASVMAGKSCASIFNTATSVSGSVPTHPGGELLFVVGNGHFDFVRAIHHVIGR